MHESIYKVGRPRRTKRSNLMPALDRADGGGTDDSGHCANTPVAYPTSFVTGLERLRREARGSSGKGDELRSSSAQRTRAADKRSGGVAPPPARSLQRRIRGHWLDGVGDVVSPASKSGGLGNASRNVHESDEMMKSSFRGVSRDRSVSKWRARISFAKAEVPLGNFANEADAAMAYDKAALLLRGRETDGLNFPLSNYLDAAGAIIEDHETKHRLETRGWVLHFMPILEAPRGVNIVMAS